MQMIHKTYRLCVCACRHVCVWLHLPRPGHVHQCISLNPWTSPITTISELLHQSIRALGKPNEQARCHRVNIKKVNQPRHQIRQGAQRQMKLNGVGGRRHVADQPWDSRSVAYLRSPKSIWKSEALGSGCTSTTDPQVWPISSLFGIQFSKM